MGPDADIGNSPILVSLAERQARALRGHQGRRGRGARPGQERRVAVQGSPSGLPTGGGRGRGPIVWGGAADARQVYYGMAAAGMGAVDASTGKTAFVFTAPGAGGRGTAGLGAAPTMIPGVVFQGAGDGRLFAVSARRQAVVGVQHRAGVRHEQQGAGDAAARLPHRARWSSTEWSTWRRVTRSAPAPQVATCCWRSGWSDPRPQ